MPVPAEPMEDFPLISHARRGLEAGYSPSDLIQLESCAVSDLSALGPTDVLTVSLSRPKGALPLCYLTRKRPQCPLNLMLSPYPRGVEFVLSGPASAVVQFVGVSNMNIRDPLLESSSSASPQEAVSADDAEFGARSASAQASSGPKTRSKASSSSSSTPASGGSSPFVRLDPLVQFRDLKEGHGKVVEKGSVVTIKYLVRNYSTHEEVDRGQSFRFTVGKKQVITGLEKGIQEMRQGGARQLIIEPRDAYGDARLLFTFEIKNVQ